MNISIIGGGHLGTSIAKGIKKADAKINVKVSNRNISKIQALTQFGIEITEQNIECINGADIVVIAVKPHQIDDVLREIKPFIYNQIIVSTATGKKMDAISILLGENVIIFRAMPNTAISNRCSMTCVAVRNATSKQKQKVLDFFNKLGETTYIDENLMDAATVLGACGIAFALRYIRAATQAGIQIGFDADAALQIVTQTVMGAAKLLAENKMHPEQEIDKVTTPQGCTIAGLNEMEHSGFSSSIIKGIQTSFLAIDKIRK